MSTSYAKKKSIFVPDYHTDNLAKVDWSFFKAEGRVRLLVDIDNTLAFHGADSADDYAVEAVRNMRNYGMQVLIFSNSRTARAEKFASSLNLPFIGNAGKPFSKKLYKLKNDREFCEQSLIVGDQIFTDLLAAKYLKTEMLLCRPRSLESETFLIKLKRFFENILKNCLSEKYKLVRSVPGDKI